MIRNGLLILLLLLTVNVFSQLNIVKTNESDKEKKEFFTNGLFFYENGDYKEALYNFLQYFFLDTGNANINYKIAMCYFNIPGQELKSIPYLKRASRKISDSYREYAYNNNYAPLHTLFFLGKAYRLNGEIDKALKVIEEFTKSPYYLEYNPSIVEKEILICKRAQILKDNPVKTETINFGNIINNEEDNFNPVISADGKVLVYVTRLKLYEAVFYSIKKNNNWIEPINISSALGTDGDMYPTSLTGNGQELYLVKRNEDGTGDIYVSTFDGENWTKAVMLGKNINTKGNESHASISEDGTRLFFTTDYKGFGGLDIYVSQKEGLDWGKAKNLGKSINTAENENTPFITNNGKLLFFSSEGHYNMGDYDVFFSDTKDGETWSEAQNMGYPINTTTNNLFFVPTDNGKAALMAKDIPGGYGNRDIYRVNLLFEPFSKIAGAKGHDYEYQASDVMP